MCRSQPAAALSRMSSAWPLAVSATMGTRGSRPADEATQLARHAQPVHAGHLHVHEDQVVAPLPGHVQCDRAIGGDVDLQALVGQHAFEDVDVDLVVFGQQQRRHPVAVGCGDELDGTPGSSAAVVPPQAAAA